MIRRGGWAALVAVTTIALLGAKAPDLLVPPDWRDISDREVCGLQRGPIGLGAYNGSVIILGVEGPIQAVPQVRELKIGERSLALVFSPAIEGIAAELDSAALAAMLASGKIEATWLPGQSVDIGDVRPAIDAISACGAKRAQKAASAAKRRDLSRRLEAAAMILGSGASVSHGRDSAAPNGVCFHRREWKSGFNRNCVYDCIGGETVQTVSAASICPLTIHR